MNRWNEAAAVASKMREVLTCLARALFSDELAEATRSDTRQTGLGNCRWIFDFLKRSISCCKRLPNSWSVT